MSLPRLVSPGQLKSDPWQPTAVRISRAWRELADVVTLELESPPGFAFEPGQFNMLYAFGVGEIPVSISSHPATPERLLHTIRDVGAVSHALCELPAGTQLGLRGPFGSGWPISELEGRDVVVISGGLGLAPLRPALLGLLKNRERYGRVCLLVGARSPADVLFPTDLAEWQASGALEVLLTVDHAPSGWSGLAGVQSQVGVVTQLLHDPSFLEGFDAAKTAVLSCGPDVMFRFAGRELDLLGVPRSAQYVSLERSMKCALGFCGHCQYGSLLVCKQGPVVPVSRIERWQGVREA
ncbi:MAG: FAD/NAD(P)-binding protein [Polyangiaceae bacterium]|nr:FAD/NAD(P)-binding protein [Polyangiaceae bacterium]